MHATRAEALKGPAAQVIHFSSSMTTLSVESLLSPSTPVMSSFREKSAKKPRREGGGRPGRGNSVEKCINVVTCVGTLKIMMSLFMYVAKSRQMARTEIWGSSRSAVPHPVGGPGSGLRETWMFAFTYSDRADRRPPTARIVQNPLKDSYCYCHCYCHLSQQ